MQPIAWHSVTRTRNMHVSSGLDMKPRLTNMDIMLRLFTTNFVSVVLASSFLDLIFTELINRPLDLEIQSGSEVRLICSTNLHFSVDWQLVLTNGTKYELYSNGHISPSFSSQFAVKDNPENGVYDLVITNISKSLEGTYMCVDNEGLGPDVASAIVMVTDANDEPVAEHRKDEKANDADNVTSQTTVYQTTNSFVQTTDFNNKPVMLMVLGVVIPAVVITITVVIGVYCKMRRSQGISQSPAHPLINEKAVPHDKSAAEDKSVMTHVFA